MEFKPHEYQARAIRFIINTPYCALFLGMGLGKTVTTLTAIKKLKELGDAKRVLIVAPKVVAESTWNTECSKWNHLRDMRTSLILGTKAQRARALATPSDLYITSRDLFSKVVTSCNVFDMIVIDELTSFKSSASERFKAFKKIRPHLSRVVGLTGTPSPNSLVDLWAQIYCIDLGERLGKYKTHYLDKYFEVYRVNNIPIKIKLKAGSAEEITKSISDICLSMQAKDYLTLPKISYKDVFITLPPSLQKKYKTFERENVYELSGSTVLASSAASLCNKLGQFSNGAIYDAEHNANALHSCKLDALREILERAHNEGDNVLVFYQYQFDCTKILELCKEMKLRARKYENSSDLEAWNSQKIDVLVSHPASTAYGLNLQRGGRVCVWYGTGWNCELYEQGNARLYRQGQTRPVLVYNLIILNTVDEQARAAIEHKTNTQAAMMQLLKQKEKEYGKIQEPKRSSI